VVRQNSMLGVLGREDCYLRVIRKQRRSQCPSIPFKGTPTTT
jgi:hypothetical protein